MGDGLITTNEIFCLGPPEQILTPYQNKYQSGLEIVTPVQVCKGCAIYGNFYTIHQYEKYIQSQKQKNSITQLKETEQQVLEMQKSLDIKKGELQNKENQAQEKLQTIISGKNITERKKEDSIKLSAETEKMSVEISTRETAVNKELDEALPAFENAKSCVDGIKKADLDQIRGFNNPPALVKLTMEAVICAINQ